MGAHIIKITYKDHCRIGSLESQAMAGPGSMEDHCRIGSLEIILHKIIHCDSDHCRIGSLEIDAGVLVPL